MKKVVGVILATLLLSNVGNAAQDPTQCPSIASVSSVGLNQINRDPSSGIFVYNDSSNYGSDTKWFFGVGVLSNKLNDKEAYYAANTALKNTVLVFGPQYSDIGGWFCLYVDTADRLFGIARTLPFTSVSDFKKLAIN